MDFEKNMKYFINICLCSDRYCTVMIVSACGDCEHYICSVMYVSVLPIMFCIWLLYQIAVLWLMCTCVGHQYSNVLGGNNLHCRIVASYKTVRCMQTAFSQLLITV